MRRLGEVEPHTCGASLDEWIRRARRALDEGEAALASRSRTAHNVAAREVFFLFGMVGGNATLLRQVQADPEARRLYPRLYKLNDRLVESAYRGTATMAGFGSLGNPALIAAVQTARGVACTPTGQDALRLAVRRCCPSGASSFIAGGLRRVACGMASGGLLPLVCAAGGSEALELALRGACGDKPIGLFR